MVQQNAPVILVHQVVGPLRDLRLACADVPYAPPPQNDPYPNVPRMLCPVCTRGVR